MRFVTIAATVLTFASLLPPAPAQTAPDERNTIEIFKRGQTSVVHVKAARMSDGEEGPAQAVGSGFFVDREGRVVTNYHVIGSSSELQIVLSDGQTLNAIVVGTAPSLDLALLKVEVPEEKEFLPLSLADSDAVQVGQKALAIGNPLGLHNTLTVGVVSGLARNLPGAPDGLGHAFLQTDTAINPGNSGGPLLDSSGRVIGVNAVMARDGQNIGFAIPANLVGRVIPQLLTMGHVYKPALGFSTVVITPGMAALFGLPVRAGLLIQEVAERSPAADAGLRPGTRQIPLNETVYVLGGDIIVTVNDKPLASPHELTAVLLGAKPGDRLRLGILRGEQRIEKSITLPPMHF